MKSRAIIFAFGLLVPIAWSGSDAVAQGAFMTAAPSGEQKSIAAPPSKDNAANGQKPKTAERCLPPGAKRPVAC